MLIKPMCISPDERRRLWKQICNSTRSQMSNIDTVFEKQYPEYKFIKVDRIQYILSWDNTEINYSFSIIGKNKQTKEKKSFDVTTVCRISDTRLEDV